jgi:hypothetical protein
VFATIEQEGRVSPREVRDQILQDRIPAVSVDEKSLFNRLPKPGHGVVLQEPQDSDKLPDPFSFLFLFPSETTAKGIKALGQIQIHQGPGMIHGTWFSFQEGQIVAVVEEDPLLAPGSQVYCHHPIIK